MKIVKTIEELLSMSKSDSIELAADIDCKGMHVPCLCAFFEGTLDGRNHTISNLVIDDPVWGDEQKISLFKHLSNACIKDIELININVLIDDKVYDPNIAGLCSDSSNSELKNISMSVFTSNGDIIPMIYSCVGGYSNELRYLCNNKAANIYAYKEGDVYER